VRLLVVSQYFWPEDFRINELVSELRSRGHVITVLTGKPNYPSGHTYPEYAAAPERFNAYDSDVRVVRVPMLARGRGRVRLLLNYLTFAVSASVIGAARIADMEFDSIFVFEPSPVTVGLPAVWLRARKGWPIALWVLDQWPESLAAVGVVRSRTLLGVVGRLVRFIYSRCDVILSPSRSLIPRIAGYCKVGQRVEYFPNWAESVYDAEDGEAAPELLGLDAAFTVLFAGNVGEAQDFPAILDAAEQLKTRRDIRWVIVGDGRMADWVSEQISRRGLSSNIILLGRFPPERMPSFFRCADALLVSLKSDPVFTMTAPGKIQSYLAFGRPILAMLDGEGAAIVSESQAGLVGAAGDSARLAENVLRLAALTTDARLAMGRKGEEYARREFSRTGLVANLEQWLTEIASDRRAGRKS